MGELTPIILKHKSWEATILPGFGNNMIKLMYNGTDVIRTPRSFEDLTSSPYLYGTPLLFPANRVSGGKFFYNSKEYYLPINEPQRHNHIHGLVYNAPFRIIYQGRNMLRSILINNDEYYPFPFQLLITTKLSDNGIHQKLCLYNTGNIDMPVSIAYHTTFNEPDQFCVPISKRYEWDDNFIPTGITTELSQSEQAYVTGNKPHGTAISGYYTACGDTAIIGKFSYKTIGFDHWTLFNGGGNKNFLCVEPQLGPVNSLNSGTAPILAVGKQMNFKWSISVHDT